MAQGFAKRIGNLASSSSDICSDTVPKKKDGLLPKDIMQTMAAVELYHAQREIANYLELAYLQLGEHPDVATEVRMTAHAARTQHLMTAGLMKKFTVTAAQIVNTMIPMILDAVDLEDKDIILEAFEQIIENAECMKKESEDTRVSYITIQTQIQGNLASVHARNKHVVDEGQRIKTEMEREKELTKAAKRAEEQLEQERKQMTEELKTLKQNRDRWMDAAVPARSRKKNGTFLDQAIGVTSFMGGGICDVIEAGINLFSNLFGNDPEEKQRKETLEAYHDSERRLHAMMKEQSLVKERRDDKKKEAMERLLKLKTLTLQQAGLGNVESLKEASLHLGDVDKQFTRIIMFWDNMAATLKYLKENVRSGEVYLKKIENPKYAERFKKSIGNAEKDWKFFGRICSDYVVESDKEIKKLYKFLSAPIDSMAAAARDKRKNELMLAIESDINAAFGDVVVGRKGNRYH